MDTLRGIWDSHSSGEAEGTDYSHDIVEDDIGAEAPPPALSQDERRMQVRAYNFWTSLLDNRNLPRIEDLDPQSLPDFGPFSVLLDFTGGIENPGITYLGGALAEECEAEGHEIRKLSDVPARSLLSRITDHYMQIIANQAPIGFEAEFINSHDVTVMYRGILLPFSSDDESIDFIYGVINWKEVADQKSADELLLEIDQALEESLPTAQAPRPVGPLADWADGPLGTTEEDRDPSEPANDIDFGAAAVTPSISFGMFDAEDRILGGHKVVPQYADESGSDPAIEARAPQAEPSGLEDWLASAREMALAANASEDRSRAALYAAIGRAHDFALATKADPVGFAELLTDAGLTMQERAPMTPVVKLVFGADYDKTRLTEFTAALAHASRLGLTQGMLETLLAQTEGGLKGIVAAERDLRRAESGKAKAPARTRPRKGLAKKLRALDGHSLDEISGQGEEFALVMIRRTAEGEVRVLGEVDSDLAMIEKVGRKLVR